MEILDLKKIRIMKTGRTGGLEGDGPEFMVFCLVTLHLWGRIFGKFLDTKGLAYADDGNIIATLSKALIS